MNHQEYAELAHTGNKTGKLIEKQGENYVLTSAPIVEEDYAARLHALGDAARYLRRREAFPVQAVYVPLHRCHAEGVYRVYYAVVVLAVGAAEERRPLSGKRLYLIRAGVDFGGYLVA